MAFKHVLLKYFITFRNEQAFQLMLKSTYMSSLAICLILCVKFDKRGKCNAFGDVVQRTQNLKKIYHLIILHDVTKLKPYQ